MKLEELFIDENMSVLQAMRRLDETGRLIVFIAPQGILKAVVTDSDIRRFMLAGGDLSQPVGKMANYSPKSLPFAKRRQARETLLQNNISALPLVDENNRIVDVEFLGDLDIDNRRSVDLPVVIMAGGLGTRLYPYTKILPKPLIPIGELPIIEHIINRFNRFGCKNFNLIVNYKKNMIKSYFNDLNKNYNIEYTDEDAPLGTGGGLALLKGKINTSFFLSNCDILIDADYNDIYEFHKKNKNIITMVCAVKNVTIPYGVVELGANGEIVKMTEKPQMNFLTNTGMYIVEPQVIEQMENGVKQGFTDVIEKYRARGERVGVYPVSENSWMDMGQLEELENMRRKIEAQQ